MMNRPAAESPGDMCVAVAMSGGVDSSVAAALLLQKGYRVLGVTLTLHSAPEPGVQTACTAEAVIKARALASQIGIPHHVVDASDEFDRLILRHVWSEYATARTPSPCLRCNELIKFGRLMDWARENGATKLATGHYARVGPDNLGRACLFRGMNRDKDQSYFLAGLTREQLEFAMFPLGELTSKSDVRELARQFGLTSAESRESQDACMAGPDQSFAEILRERYHAASRPGFVLDEEGGVLGRHPGIHRYTVGQRRGIPIQASSRHWVKALRPGDAAIIVTGDETHLYGNRLTATDLNWIGDRISPDQQLHCTVQVRYRHAAAPAVLSPAGPDRILVEFKEPVRAITPGQAVVFYDDARVLGRGWIENPENTQPG